MRLIDLFGVHKPVIGMLHSPALPGAPRNALAFDAIIDWVLKDGDALVDAGIDGIMLENFGDAPFYPSRVPSDTVAFMTRLAVEVRARVKLPLGINVLRNDAISAIAIAAATGAAFIRVNIHTGARLTDQGVLQGDAHETLRFRKALGSDVKIFADVDVKHSAPIASRDIRIEVEELIARGGADAVIVTGSGTGAEPALEDLKIAKAAAGATPVIAGSGADMSNLAELFGVADGLIIGTALKKDGVITNAIDPERARALTKAAQRFR